MTNFIGRTPLLGALLLSFVAGVPAAAGPDEVVAFRKHVMGVQGNAARQLRAISRGELDQDANFGRIAVVMVAATRMIPDAFRERVMSHESEVETTVAENGIIWEDWDDFTSRVNALLIDSERLEALALSGDLDGAKAALDGVFSHCRGCHDKYRDR